MARTNTAPAHAPEGMPRARAWVEHLDRLPNVFFLPFGHIPSLASSLRAAVHEADRLSEELATLRRQLDAAEAQPADREQLLALIDALTDDSDCWFDHNGMCQGHGVSLDPGQRCPHAEAKELLAAQPNPLESVVTEALADIAAQPADPEPAPAAPPWLIEAGDD